MPQTNGTYLHLQRLSTEDGPGIRTTVFMKGCLLRCRWCHNPESLSREPQIQRIETNCIRCGTCLQVCPAGALESGSDFVHIQRTKCDACGLCVDACPAGALEMLGTRVTPDELLQELIKDQNYYHSSGGGVTLSGGEPALQPDFCAALMQRLQSHGIHTALDTCGMVSSHNLQVILPYTDMILYDIKEIDPAYHVQFTGQSNEVILENLLMIRETISAQDRAARLWIRTPLIPGATARRENLLGIGAFLADQMDGFVERWELCAFNNLCRDKYRRLGMTWDYNETPLLTGGELQELEYWANESGFPPGLTFVTGAVQLPA